MSLCGERHAVGEGACVDSSVGVHMVLPYSACCIYAHSIAAFVRMLVLCCYSFSPYLCIYMFRAFGLQGWAFV